LLQCLSKTVDACEIFCVNHAIYFQNLSNPSDGGRSLQAIQITFTELDSLRNELECLTESCTEFAQDVGLDRYLIHQGFIRTVFIQNY
jgi:hypothetical protein